MDRCIYLICYDISDRNAQRKVHNLVKAHAIGGQKSFYECLMSQNELHALVNNIQKNNESDNGSTSLFSTRSPEQTALSRNRKTAIHPAVSDLLNHRSRMQI